jgi:EpsI family protein
MAVTLAGVYTHENRQASGLAQPLGSIQPVLGRWVSTGTKAEIDPAVMRKLLARDYLQRNYANADQQVELWVSYHENRRPGEGLHSPKSCLPGSGWEFANLETIPIPTSSGSVLINRATVRKGGDRRVVLYWYQNAKRAIASEYRAKAYQVWDALLTGQTGATLVRITAFDNPEAIEAATQFAPSAYSAVDQCFRGATSQQRAAN